MLDWLEENGLGLVVFLCVLAILLMVIFLPRPTNQDIIKEKVDRTLVFCIDGMKFAYERGSGDPIIQIKGENGSGIPCDKK